MRGPLDPSEGKPGGFPLEPLELPPASASFTYQAVAHVRAPPPSWQLSPHTAHRSKVAGNLGPQQEGGLCCQHLPPPTVTQRGSSCQKDTHIGLSQLHKATLLKAAGPGSLSGWQRPDLGVPSACHGLHTVPRHRGYGYHPPSSRRAGKEWSKYTGIRGALRRAGWVKQQINAALLRPREAEVGRGREEGAWSAMHPSPSQVKRSQPGL